MRNLNLIRGLQIVSAIIAIVSAWCGDWNLEFEMGINQWWFVSVFLACLLSFLVLEGLYLANKKD